MAKHRGAKTSSKAKTKAEPAPKPAPPPLTGTPRQQAAANSQENRPRNPAEHLAKYRFPPGTSGNPKGRPKKVFDPLLREFLNMVEPTDKRKRTRAQIFVEEFYKRALKKSDQLAREMLARIDGMVEHDPDIDPIQAGVKVIILDAPRPQRPAINIPALPANTSAKGDD